MITFLRSFAISLLLFFFFFFFFFVFDQDSVFGCGPIVSRRSLRRVVPRFRREETKRGVGNGRDTGREEYPINGWMANVGTILGFFGNYRLSEFFCNPAICRDLVASVIQSIILTITVNGCDFFTWLDPSRSLFLLGVTTNCENAERQAKGDAKGRCVKGEAKQRRLSCDCYLTRAADFVSCTFVQVNTYRLDLLLTLTKDVAGQDSTRRKHILMHVTFSSNGRMERYVFHCVISSDLRTRY